MKRFLICMMLCLLCLPVVTSVGMAPSHYSITHSYFDDDFTVRILNREGINDVYALDIVGELADYVHIETDTLYLEPDSSVSFTYSLDLPDNLRPGQHTIDFILRPLPNAQEDKLEVSAKVEIRHKAIINIPYPRSYFDAILYGDNLEVGSVLPLMIHVVNRGSEDASFSGVLQVRDGQDVIQEQPVSFSLGGLSDERISVQLDPLFDAGQYTFRLVGDYANQELDIEKSLSVGRREVVANTLTVDDFVVGEISKLDLYITNEWNQPLEGVYADVEFSGDQYSSTYRTGAVDVDAYGQNILPVFWDTRNLPIGDYLISAEIYFEEYSLDYSFNAYLGADNLQIFNDELSGQVIGADNENTNPVVLLVIVLLISNGVFIGLYIYKKNAKKK